MPRPVTTGGAVTIRRPASSSRSSSSSASVSRSSMQSRTGAGVRADSGGADLVQNWDYPNGVLYPGPTGPQATIDTGAVPAGSGGYTAGTGVGYLGSPSSSGKGGKNKDSGPDWSPFDAGYTQTPDWWSALKPKTWDDSTGQLALLNLLIPSLSPEDRRQVVSSIYLADPANFAHLNPENLDFSPPGSIDAEVKDQYQGVLRAEETLQALSRLAEAVGKQETDMGAGYSFLKLVSDAMRDTSSPERQTRQQYVESTGAIEPTLSSMKADKEASGMSGLASMLARPFFSTGKLTNAQQQSDGTFAFGSANSRLFF